MTDQGSVAERLKIALLHGNDISAGDDFVFLDALDSAEAMERENDLLREALKAAPPLLGVWNIAGRRSISEEALSAFAEAYNAWAALARSALDALASLEQETG